MTSSHIRRGIDWIKTR